jgi:pSer/pThr/pTyr-binding forkhead associated (FHA) protein
VHTSTTDPLDPKDGPATTLLKLVVVSGPSTGAELLLERGTYRVGKQAGNEFVLADSTVSRCHLVLEVLGDRVRVTDNGSRNGTFFKGRRFNSMEVGPGASVQLGRSSLQFEAVERDDPLALPYKQAREQVLQRFEREYVIALLVRHRNNVSEAARAAGIDRTYLHRLIRRLGLDIG